MGVNNLSTSRKLMEQQQKEECFQEMMNALKSEKIEAMLKRKE